MLNALHTPKVVFICTHFVQKNTVQFEILYFKTLLLHILEYPSYLLFFSTKIKKILEEINHGRVQFFHILGKSNCTSGSTIQKAFICSNRISSSDHNRTQWPYENTTHDIYSCYLTVWNNFSSIFDTNKKFSFNARCMWCLLARIFLIYSLCTSLPCLAKMT